MPILTTAGAVATSPTDLLNQEIAAASALAPGLTANLPGSLVEDMASTAAGAVVIQDQTFVDLVNSISPYTANPFILYQLGAVYGVQQGIGSNTSVYVIFTGLAGFVIPIGFTVSDGTYQYTVQDGGIIGSSGQSPSLYCLATTAGSWAVPAGTVINLVTSVPSGFTLTVTNPSAGLAGATAQTIQSYQAQVIQAGLATAQGMPTFVKTQLQNVSGVQNNLVTVRNLGSNQWQIICGGGDPYQVANAIFNAIPDISILTGSTLLVTAITNANPAVVTTNLNHGYSNGQLIQFTGVTGMSGINNISGIAISAITWSSSTVTVTLASAHGLSTGDTATGIITGCTPTGYNGTFTITSTGTTTFTYSLTTNPGTISVKGTVSTWFLVTKISSTTFSINTNSTSSGSYTSGGVITPNLRNETVTIYDYPDSYNITFVIPPSQLVNINLVWNTSSSNYVSPSAVAQLGQPALAAYINSIYVGQPINVFEMQSVFQTAIQGIIPPQSLSRMVFTVAINGVDVSPSSGTGLIYGDPESYFSTSSAYISIAQG
jgi:hypothetical protein